MSSIEAIFGLQLIYSLLVFGLLAKWLVVPFLAKKTLYEALFWLILPHAFRHIGMVFLVPGVVSESLGSVFSNPTAYGDLISAFLALLIMYLIKSKKLNSVYIIWVFNIFGFADLVLALSNADAIPYLNAAWYIPTMLVPLLLVSHVMIFKRLITKKG